MGASPPRRPISQKISAGEFDSDYTISEWLTQYSENKDVTYVRGFLGRMLFAGETASNVKVFGGEKGTLSVIQDDDLRRQCSPVG